MEMNFWPFKKRIKKQGVRCASDVVVVKDRDVLVISTDGHLTQNQRVEVIKNIAVIFPNNRVFIIDGEARLTVVKDGRF